MHELVPITDAMALGPHRFSPVLHGGLAGVRDNNALHLAEGQAFPAGHE
jgi:hypothetical protein